MTLWRMQLHPNLPGEATKHAIESVAAGYIGLDFKWDVGDLTRADYDALPAEEKVQWAFAHEMAIGDHVLVFLRHYPFALVRVAGDYNYMRTPTPEMGVWFRHFRQIDDVRYYFDHEKNPGAWKKLVMTATITPLRSDTSGSRQLIEEWLGRE